MRKIFVFFLGLLLSLILLESSLRIIGHLNNLRPEHDSNNKSKKVILCVGDSFTYSAGVNDGEDYPSYLNKLLGEDKYRVINKGVPTCNTSMLLKRLPKWLNTYKPYITIAQIGECNYWNFRDYSYKKDSLIDIVDSLTQKIRILRLIKLILIKFNIIEYNEDETLQEFLFDSSKDSRKTIPLYEPEPFIKPNKNSLSINRSTGKGWDALKHYRFYDAISIFRDNNSNLDQLGEGICFFKQTLYLKALNIFATLYNNKNKNPYITAWYCRALIENNKLFEAFSILRENKNTFFLNDSAYDFCMSLIYLKIKNFSLSLKWLNRVIKYSPSFGEAYYKLAEIYCNDLSSYNKKASYYFEAGTKKAPDFIENYIGLIDQNMKNNPSSERIFKLFDDLEKQFPENIILMTEYTKIADILNYNKIDKRISILKIAIKKEPLYLPAYIELINTLVKDKKYIEALSICKKANTLFINNKTIIKLTADIFYNLGDINKALDNYMLIKDSLPSQLLVRVSKILISKNKIKRAKELLKKAISNNVKCTEAYYTLGRYLKDNGEYNKSLYIFNNGCEIAQSSKCALELAKYYDSIKDLEHVKYYITKALNREWTDFDKFKELISIINRSYKKNEIDYLLYKFMKTHTNSPEINTFIVSFLERSDSIKNIALSLDPILKDNIKQHDLINRGYDNIYLGDFKKAESFFRESLKHGKNKALAYNCIGLSLKKQKRFSESITYFKKALDLKKEMEYFQNLAFTYNDNLNDLISSQKILIDAIRFFPFDNDLKRILAELYYTKEDFKMDEKYYSLAHMDTEASFLKRFILNKKNNLLSSNIQIVKNVDSWLMQDFSKIVDLCRKSGSIVVFQNYPENKNNIMIKFAQKNKIIFNDNYSKFSNLLKNGGKREDYILIGDGHCNPKGNLQTAKNLVEVLKNNSLLY